MAETTTINGIECRVSETSKGKIYSHSFRSLKEEAQKMGTTSAEVNEKKHAFFLNNTPYYIGPSLQGKTAAEIAAMASQISVCESSTDGNRWVSCLFLPQNTTRVELVF